MLSPIASKIMPRKDIKSNWELYNPILFDGELGIEYPDTGIGTGYVKVKIGDGLKTWKELSYAIEPETAVAIYGGNSSNSNDIWLRSDINENWMTLDPILGLGEIVYDLSFSCFKVGDGVHHYSELKYIGREKERVYDFDFGDISKNP